MIKKITINDSMVPVPVPIRDLQEALSWVYDCFAKKKGSVITSVVLDGREHEVAGADSVSSIPLKESSALCITVESSIDLSSKVFEAIGELSIRMGERLNKTAVYCWKGNHQECPNDLGEVSDDLALLKEMIKHLHGLVNRSHEEVAGLHGAGALLARNIDEFESLKQSKAWKKLSIILVNRIYPLLRELSCQCDNIQVYLYSTGQIQRNDQIVKDRIATGESDFFV